MKGGILALRSTKVAFVLVTLICTTFIICGWDKTPFIVSLIPENQFFKVSPEILIGSSVKKSPDGLTKDAGNDVLTPTINEMAHKSNEKVFDAKAPNNSPMNHDKELDKDILIRSPATKTPDGQSKDAGDDFLNATAYKPNEKVFDVGALNISPIKHDKRRDGACNYAKGKWVEDDHRPFYFGGRCRQWL